MKRKANFNVLFVEGKKKQNKNLWAQYSSITYAQLLSRWLEITTPYRGESGTSSYGIYTHLCMQR